MKKISNLMKIATVCLCCTLFFSLAGCAKGVTLTEKFNTVQATVLLKMGDDYSLRYDSRTDSKVGSCIVTVYATEIGEGGNNDGISFIMYWEASPESDRTDDCSLSLGFSRNESGEEYIRLAYFDENYGLTSYMGTLKEELVFSDTFWSEGTGNLTNSGNANPAKEYVSERLLSAKETFNAVLQIIMDDTNITLDDLYV